MSEPKALRALAELCPRLHASPSTDEALDVLARGSRELFGAELVVILLRGPEPGEAPSVRLALAGHLVAPEGQGPSAALAAELLRVPWGESLRLGEAELAASMEWRALRALAGDAPFELRGLLAARLSNRDGVTLGCVLLSDPRGGDFSAADESVLELLARGASIALENARRDEAARRAIRARDDVLAVVSHDLRNPLHVVSMSAALLRANVSDCGPDAPRDLAVIERIERATTRMGRMIDDLLDATRVDAGELAVATTKEQAVSLVEEALDSVTRLAGAKGVVLRRGPLDESIVVMADRARVRQLFSNLLGNSLKRTERGSAITLSLTRGRDEACFAVENEGPGVDAAGLALLLDRYSKGNDATREGAGLGLFLARRIAEAHGGRIAVESERGRGTTVRFWLPVSA